MKFSQLFTKTRREAPADETSLNAQLLIRAGFIHKEMAGVYSYLPLGLRVLKNIEQIIREEMNSVGAQEIFMPSLHSLENYQKTGRQNIDVLFFTELKSGGKLVLGQSHEEIVTPLVKEYVSSYKDFPLAVYQFQTKFRNELRAKSGIFRGREFMMKDMYSFHANETEFENYYERMKDVYSRVFSRAGIGKQTYRTYASGGTFSKYSDEYQTLTEAGEDTIYLCEDCGLAINDEIISDVDGCLKCKKPKADLLKKKAIEVGNIFPLKNRFSEAFDFYYQDEAGQRQPVIMGCYGIGLGRLMGTIVEVLADNKGIVWPQAVAPFKFHLISLDEGQVEAAKVYDWFLKRGIAVLWDDRADKSAGEKFSDADLIGITSRLVISRKTLQSNAFELKNRQEPDSKFLPLTNIEEVL